MGEVLDALDIIGIAVLIVVLLAQSGSFIFWVRFELRQQRKDMEEMETKRADNVKHLRNIYDLKVSDAKAYSKSLFETQSSEIKSISDRMVGVESSLNKIIDLLINPKK